MSRTPAATGTRATPRPGTRFTTSADGTRVAFESTGSGPALVLVDGALCFRRMGPSQGLAAALRDRFTVYSYDRRGRGESGPGASPATLEREVEDLLAVIGAAGGPVHLLGISSGAVLALEAAQRGAPVNRIVGYEAPMLLDATQPATDPDLPAKVRRMVDQGRRGAAVATFLEEVGAPAFVRALMRVTPIWRKLTRLAHTLPSDLGIVVPLRQGQPLNPERYARVTQETLVVAGGRSPEAMRNAQAAIAAALPHGHLVTLSGQTHMVKPAVLAPAVTRHLLEGPA